MPGVDPKVVMQWVIDNPFRGSLAAASVFGIYCPMRILEWSGLAFFSLLYEYEKHPNLPYAKTIAAAKIDQTVPWPWAHPDQRVRERFVVQKWRSQLYTLAVQTVSALMQLAFWASVVQIEWRAGKMHWEWITGDVRLTKADPATIPSKWVVAYQASANTSIRQHRAIERQCPMRCSRLLPWHV
jgi:hypothetical protein